MKINLEKLKFEQIKSLIAVTDKDTGKASVTRRRSSGDFVISQFKADTGGTGFVLMFNSAFVAMKKEKTIAREEGWPEWANWYAIDEDGTCFVYAEKPKVKKGYYTFTNKDSTQYAFVSSDKIKLKNWKKSLRKIVDVELI